jgi:hypothetical protein
VSRVVLPAQCSRAVNASNGEAISRRKPRNQQRAMGDEGPDLRFCSDD